MDTVSSDIENDKDTVSTAIIGLSSDMVSSDIDIVNSGIDTMSSDIDVVKVAG